MFGGINDFMGSLLQAIALVGSALLRIALSPWEGRGRALLSFVTAVFCGLFLPAPSLAFLKAWLHINPDDYMTLTIILWSLTGEGVMKFVLTTIKTPKSLGDMVIRVIKAFRGSP